MTKKFLRGFQYVFLSICSIISIFPFIWMIIAATNKSVDVTKGTLMPGNYLMENLKAVFSSDLQYGMAFKNSLVIACCNYSSGNGSFLSGRVCVCYL